MASSSLRPKIHGYKRTGFVKPGNVKLAMGRLLHGEAAPWNCALQTPLPLWIHGLVCHTLMACCETHMYRVYQVELSCWPPSLDSVCSTLCSNCHNCLLARHMILHDFLWHVQCMVLGPWVDLIHCSSHPAIWLRKVGLLSSQSEPWFDATCSIGCAENQALVNHRCSAEHVLLHALVKYTIQLALQHTCVYTWYNRVFWA